jgi:hypothetical protein
MGHIRKVTVIAHPNKAETPTEVWLTLLRDVIDAFIPFFTGKEPNPVPLVPEETP